MTYFGSLSPLGKRHKPIRPKATTPRAPLGATVEAASDAGEDEVSRDQWQKPLPVKNGGSN